MGEITVFKSISRLALPAVVAIAGFAGAAQAVTVTDVDLELSLLVDVSGSVDNNEFILQRQGYVDAFNSAAVQTAITSGNIGKIAVNLIYWSSAGSQAIGVGWTLIDSAASSSAFATAVAGAARTSSGLTAPGSAIAFADPLFDSNMYNGTRNVIDVSGDGAQNDGISTAGASATFCGQGSNYAINGIVIGGSASVLSFYQNNVQCGANSFVSTASSFSDFGKAVQAKLIREITGGEVPVPGAVWLLAGGLGGLFGLKRRKKAA